MLKVLPIALLACALSMARPAWAQEPMVSVPASAIYDAESKSTVGAFVLELFIPGAGSVYAGDVAGAVTTWMLFGVGLLAATWAVDSLRLEQPNSSARPVEQPFSESMMAAGVIIILAGRIYGLANAITATGRYNGALGAQLGLGQSISMAPLVTPNSGGLAVVGRF